MVKKTDRRKRDIKTKLMAAICMLMVSCIMVISSTYAWFTLSTAPEVTGISTAVGANGNLEMALLPSGIKNSDNTITYYTTARDALDAIGNASGNLSTTEANITWGNLVDLSDATYGLDKITLFPSTLEISGGKVPTHYLSTPAYGADGRYSGLNSKAISAIHVNGAFGTSGFGVRAIGTSSGMTGLEIAYRDALSAGNSAFNNAITKAKATVSTGGSTLASMAVARALNGDSAVFSETDKATLVQAYTDFDATLALVETALRNYVIADVLTTTGAASETTYDALVTQIKGATLDELVDFANATMKPFITKLDTLRTDVSGKLNGLKTLTTDATGTREVDDGTGTGNTTTETYPAYSWTKISPFVSNLANVDGMLLNDQPMSYWMEKDGTNYKNLGSLIGQMKNLVMKVNASRTDNLLFAQLADFIDDFTTPATINGISYQGISADGLEVTMKIFASEQPAHLPTAKTEANTIAPDFTFGGGGTLISDFYGYIIDMGFRTNAAGSSLQIQTEAIDRIYADNESNPATMGGGSSMTFTVPASGFDVAKLKNLMTFIRVVYFDPTADNVIYCEARLDINTAKEGTEDGNATVTMELKKWNPDGNGGNGAWATDSKITDLDQNMAKAVSAMVYLDGVEISNEDVANVDLTGKMNLQFSSSAELKPMEYGDLRENNGTDEEEGYSVSVNGQTIRDVTVNEGASYTFDVSTVTVPDGQAINTVTVTMGGQTVENAYSDGKVTIPSVDGDIEVTVTFKSAT